MLAAGSGAIVNISSAIGRLRDRGFVAYGTAKAALTHMTRLMAADLAPKVRVNAIAVGSVATSALEIVLDNQEIHDEMVRRTPREAPRPAGGHRVLRAVPRVARRRASSPASSSRSTAASKRPTSSWASPTSESPVRPIRRFDVRFDCDRVPPEWG